MVEGILRQRFEDWKRNYHGGLDLSRRPDGQYADYVVRCQWASYRQAMADMYTPTESQLEAMTEAGARRAWAADIYRASMDALIHQPRTEQA